MHQNMVFFLLTNRRIWCKISNIILNRVRSVCWEEKEYEKCEKMVVVKTTLEIPEYGIYYESFGGNDNQDVGDAYKGATTDAITKIGSYLGIGIDVFKGKHTHNKPKDYEDNSTESKNNNFTVQNNNVQVEDIRKAESIEELTEFYNRIQNMKSEKAKAFLTGELTKRKNKLLNKQQ